MIDPRQQKAKVNQDNLQKLVNGEMLPTNKVVEHNVKQFNALRQEADAVKNQLARVRQQATQLEAQLVRIDGKLEHLAGDIEYWHNQGDIHAITPSTAPSDVPVPDLGRASDGPDVDVKQLAT